MTNLSSIGGKLRQPLKVKTSKMQIFLIVALGLFFVPMGFWNLSRALTTGFALVPTVMTLILFASFGSVAFLFSRSMRLLPKVFDAQGVVRRDGRKFNWKDLKRVEHQLYTNKYSGSQRSIWRIEIQFENGTVWLLPLKIVNFNEVYQLVLGLTCEHTEKNQGRAG